jgi:hypothetical protein
MLQTIHRDQRSLIEMTASQQRSSHRDGALPASPSAIFVFGSNLAGRHGLGAALAARQKFGAKHGVGAGLTGRSYAIPTKDAQLRVLPLSIIEGHVQTFLTYAAAQRATSFYVTRIGCGLAGYGDEQIAPMFSDAPLNCSFADDWKRFIETIDHEQCLNNRYHGARNAES